MWLVNLSVIVLLVRICVHCNCILICVCMCLYCIVVTLYVCMCTRPGKNGYSDWSEYKLQIKSNQIKSTSDHEMSQGIN